MNKSVKKPKTKEDSKIKSNKIDSNVADIDKIVLEIRALVKILIIANSDKIESELNKHATTDERKMSWVLIDGKRSVKDIAKITKVTERAVYLFLEELKDAELIEKDHTFPKRTIDYIPIGWRKLLKTPNTKQKVTE